MSNVQSKPIEAQQRRGAPQIGVIPPSALEVAFILLLYIGIILLIVLSVFGTFFGLQQQAAPPVWEWWAAVRATPGLFGAAVIIQIVLTLFQYGTRQMTRHHRGWWIGYLLALGVSVYYNLLAYYAPAVALGAPWWLAAALIIAADIVPEFVMVRRR